MKVVYEVEYTGGRDDFYRVINKKFEYEDESDIFAVYMYIDTILQLQKIKFSLISYLNDLQSWQWYNNYFESIDNTSNLSSAKGWSSKGKIPYPLINPIIEIYNLKITRKEIK